MPYRFNKLFFATISLLIPLWLAACSTVVPVEKVEDPRMEQLVSAMDRCLANQALANEQLQGQKQQLEQQTRQLDVLTEGLAGAGAEPLSEGAGITPAIVSCAGPAEPGKLLVGQLEQVWLQNLQLALPARIDTGAETASLDARNIEPFERDGRRWVRFEIMHPDTGQPLLLERKLNRMVAIVQSNSAESERRPVIKLGITIGQISQTAEFTLSNRSHLDYQLLIGRNILQDVMVVDVSKKNIAPYTVPRNQADSGETTP